MGSVRDRNIGWLRKRLYIPVSGFGGYNVNALVTGGQGAGVALQIDVDTAAAVFGKQAATNRNLIGATAATDKNLRMQAIGNGTPRLVAIPGNVDHQGLLVVAADDGVEFFGMIPYDIDPSKPVGFRCWWSSAAAAVGARTITWRVQRGLTKAGTIPAVVTTALDTVITAQAPVGTANAIERGNRGIMNKDIILKDHFFWGFEVVMSAFDGSFTEDKLLLGLEIDYMPRMTYGPGRLLDKAALTNPFDLESPE